MHDVSVMEGNKKRRVLCCSSSRSELAVNGWRPQADCVRTEEVLNLCINERPKSQ